MNEYITNRVHDLYWKEDINCARTALVCLSELFEITIELLDGEQADIYRIA